MLGRRMSCAWLMRSNRPVRRGAYPGENSFCSHVGYSKRGSAVWVYEPSVAMLDENVGENLGSTHRGQSDKEECLPLVLQRYACGVQPCCPPKNKRLVIFLVVFNLTEHSLKDLLIPGRRVAFLIKEAGHLGFKLALDAVVVHPIGIKG